MAIFYISREINLFLEILSSDEHSKMLVSGNLKPDSFKLRDMKIKSQVFFNLESRLSTYF